MTEETRLAKLFSLASDGSEVKLLIHENDIDEDFQHDLFRLTGDLSNFDTFPDWKGIKFFSVIASRLDLTETLMSENNFIFAANPSMLLKQHQEVKDEQT